MTLTGKMKEADFIILLPGKEQDLKKLFWKKKDLKSFQKL